MAIYLVTYDLKAPGRNYQPVHDYLKRFTHCKGLESVYLIDTESSATQVCDALKAIIDANDVVLVIRLARNGASHNYTCMKWINESGRSW